MQEKTLSHRGRVHVCVNKIVAKIIWRYFDLVQKKTCDFTSTVNKGGCITFTSVSFSLYFSLLLFLS